jgi:hypothetical protein
MHHHAKKAPREGDPGPAPQSPCNELPPPGREDAPPDPGIKPGGIRDRAVAAVMQRGPSPEDKEKTRASQEFWKAFKEAGAVRVAALKASNKQRK